MVFCSYVGGFAFPWLLLCLFMVLFLRYAGLYTLPWLFCGAVELCCACALGHLQLRLCLDRSLFPLVLCGVASVMLLVHVEVIAALLC